MKIIQSFAKFDDGSPYVGKANPYINLYTFLLSYLTLKKYYGFVTMVCNKDAYDSFIKYIPYDDIIISECSYDFKLWGAYKIDALKLFSDDIIHVDPDVFLFNDVLKPFIDGDYGAIVQNVLPSNEWVVDVTLEFIKKNEVFLRENNIITLKEYDNRFSCCAVNGHKKDVRKLYLEVVNKLEAGMRNSDIVIDNPMILEEASLHFTILKNNIKTYDILPYDIVCKYSMQEAGNLMGYTHMNSSTKFNLKYIELIKNKIKKSFPQSSYLLERYDLEYEKYNSELINN